MFSFPPFLDTLVSRFRLVDGKWVVVHAGSHWMRMLFGAVYRE